MTEPATPRTDSESDASGDRAEQSRSLGSRLLAGLRELLVVVVMALALSFVIKTWVIQAFYIPSGSMEDTLVLNDRVIVNKLVPKAMDLQRGDVVVFTDPDHWLSGTVEPPRGPVMQKVHDALSFVGLLPSESDDHLIKRVIGLPGDHVACCDAKGRVTVNGSPIDESYIKPGDVPSAIPFEVTVPAGKVWVMGDHRSDSEDSRFHNDDGASGAVPIEKITGRAIAIVWPLDRIGWLPNFSATFANIPSAPASPTDPASPSPATSSP